MEKIARQIIFATIHFFQNVPNTHTMSPNSKQAGTAPQILPTLIWLSLLISTAERQEERIYSRETHLKGVQLKIKNRPNLHED